MKPHPQRKGYAYDGTITRESYEASPAAKNARRTDGYIAESDRSGQKETGSTTGQAAGVETQELSWEDAQGVSQGKQVGKHENRCFPLHLWALRCWRWPNKIDGMSYRTLTRQSVLDAMLSLHHKGIAVTRESLQRVTGEPLAKIREHIDSLIDSGQVERLHRGVYRPVIPYSNRPITVTAMPDGSAKIEVGDDLLMLSPVESGCLGQLLQGFMVTVRRA